MKKALTILSILVFICMGFTFIAQGESGDGTVTMPTVPIPTHTCTHTAGSPVRENEVAATCTATGSYDAVTYCSLCGEEMRRVKGVRTPVLGHNFEAGDVIPPTCTADGYTVYTCTRCGETENRDATAALGHTAGEAVHENETAPDCTAEGTYEAVTYCTECGEELGRETVSVPALGHTYEATVSAPSCTEIGYTTYTCIRCGYTYIDNETPTYGHSWGQWRVTAASSCTEAGEESRTCTRCGETETRELSASGHQYQGTVTASTCTQSGYTTYTCSRCGDTYTADETAALGHNYKGTVTAPTCTQSGYTTYTCSRCDDTYTADETAALGHDYKGTVTAPTCTQSGYTTYTCSRCGDTYTADETAALGHDYVATVTPPTATERGYTTHTCSRCGDSYVDSYTEPLSSTDPTLPTGETDYDTSDIPFSTEPTTTAYDISSSSISNISVASVKANLLYVGWNTLSPIVSGYQIQYSTSSSFTASATKSVTVKGGAVNSVSIHRLKGGTKYYVRVRAYYNGKEGTSYSKWSRIKSATVIKEQR